MPRIALGRQSCPAGKTRRYFHRDGIHILKNEHERLNFFGRLANQLDALRRLRLLQSARGLTDLRSMGEALRELDQAIALNPGCAEAHANRGHVLAELKRPAEALASCDRAIALRPDLVQAHNNRSNALLGLGRLAEALETCDCVLAMNPDDTDACTNRGIALMQLGRPAGALSSFNRAVTVKGDHAKAHNGRASALEALGRLDEAVSAFDRAIEFNPNLPEVHSNRGNALQDLMRHDEALESLAKAVSLDPDYASAHWNASLTRLLFGDFEAGWKLYEWRWRVDLPNWPIGIPRWLGEEQLDGKTIVLHAEQGLGDAIQFCRYAKLVAARGATVLLQVRPALTALLRNLEGVSRVLAGGERLPPHDFHCPLLSLPLAFDTRLETIPAEIPYLFADPERAKRWHERLGASSAPRIGVAWAGSATHKNDRNRSIALRELLTAIPPGVRCCSLQKELRDGDRELLRDRPDIVHLGDELADLTETAAVLSQLDLLISADTSVVHLAGALGRPVWVLLPFAPDWRWLLDRDDSPWYPTARLFRQTRIGDWSSVLSRVRDELTAAFPR